MMAVAGAGAEDVAVVRGRWRPSWVGYAALVALVAWWAWRAFDDAMPWDTGLAYTAGQVAWATGHPEHLASWISTPFLGAVMALLSRVFSVRGVADLVTVVNVVLWVGAVGVLLHRMRGVLSAVWWWILALALLSFAPLMSSVWFKQFNVMALVLSVAGFELVRRRRVGWGAAAIGLSVAIKPLVVLLPVVMLARRETRRAGALAVAWVVGLNVAAQALMAQRAHDLATLDPLIGLRNVLDKTKPNFFSCLPSNFAPVSLICRMGGGDPLLDWKWQRFASVFAVALLGAWVVDALRGRGATSWEVLAFTCPLSVMLSSVAWTHYQIMLAPLFCLLFIRFVREGATLGTWAGLLTAFVLASLIWAPQRGSPYGSIFMAIKGVVGRPPPPNEPRFVEGVAQLAQYLLVVTGVVWYLRRQSLRARPLGAGGQAAAGDDLR